MQKRDRGVDMLNWLKALWRRGMRIRGTRPPAQGDPVEPSAHRTTVEKREPVLVRGELWFDTSEDRLKSPEEQVDLPEPGIEDFAEQLVQAHKRDVRRYAAERLGELGGAAAPAIPALLNAAGDADEMVREAALNALHMVDPAWPQNAETLKALPCLVDRLKNPIPEVRRVAFRLLRLIGRPAIPYLASTLSDGEDTIDRVHVIRVLSRIDPAAASTVPGLTRALSSQFLHVRIAAAKSLTVMGSPPETAIPTLVAGLAERSADARQAMAACLARAGPVAEPAIPALLPLLADRNAGVRDAAAEALEQIGRPAVPALIELVRTRDAQRLKAWAESMDKFAPWRTTRRDDVLVIESWESWKNLWWAAYDVLEQRNRLEAAQQVALRVLGKLGADASEAVPAIIQSLSDPNPGIRVAAMQGLGQVGPEAREAVSELVLMLVHENQSVREAAVEALQAIDRDWPKDPAVPGIVAVFSERLSDTGTYGESAVHMLIVIGSAAVPVLIDTLGSGNRVARENAARALGCIGAAAETAIPALTEALQDGHPLVREQAAGALANIEKQIASIPAVTDDGDASEQETVAAQDQ